MSSRHSYKHDKWLHPAGYKLAVLRFWQDALHSIPPIARQSESFTLSSACLLLRLGKDIFHCSVSSVVLHIFTVSYEESMQIQGEGGIGKDETLQLLKPLCWHEFLKSPLKKKKKTKYGKLPIEKNLTHDLCAFFCYGTVKHILHLTQHRVWPLSTHFK